jgi:hypothetical protein
MTIDMNKYQCGPPSLYVMAVELSSAFTVLSGRREQASTVLIIQTISIIALRNLLLPCVFHLRHEKVSEVVRAVAIFASGKK